MKNSFLFCIALLWMAPASFAQVGINNDNSSPDNSAMLDVKSTVRGMLVPRMTTIERDAISNPATGLLVFCIGENQYYCNKGTPETPAWVMVSSQWLSSGSDIYFNGGKVGLGIENPTYPLHVAGDINFTGTLRKNGIPVISGVSSVTANSPLFSTGGSNPTISIPQANSLVNGFLSSDDWNIFNQKQNALVFGSVTSADIAISGGNGAVIGSGINLAVNKGNLISPDIAVTGGTGSVLGTGTLLSIIKGNLVESGSTVLNITGGTNAVLGTNTTIQVKQANTTQSGYLSNTDWNSFNNKVSSQWISNGARLYYNAGNVGIGTSNPQNKADIAGNMVIGSSYSGSSVAPANGLLVEGKVAVGTNAPSSSALMELKSTTNGVLLPRMTRAQRNVISSPEEGLMVYCTNCGTNGALSIFTNGTWLTFSPCTTASPTAGTHIMTPGQVIWKWLAVSGAAGYRWNTVADYETATDMGTALSKTETGTVCDTTYTRYLWAYSSCGESAMAIITATVPALPPPAPIAATHSATQTSIVWNWHLVAGATGYKWNTVNDYSTALDLGVDTTKTETGDTCGTVYTRYVWAYNECGYSAADTLTQSTVICFICGISTLVINHTTTGGVAPVNKTTTYGTVTNIPGEITKCWITSNLGSDHQATAVNDATEPSAGWYWQFNRKQGYKNDGTLTPAWPGVITENSDWIPANDPCTLELGTQWRIPSYTEWYNVLTVGGWQWSDWNLAWNSGLKLHAGGYLYYINGSLGNSGVIGHFYSATQYNSDNGHALKLEYGGASLILSMRGFGNSLRCLK